VTTFALVGAGPGPGPDAEHSSPAAPAERLYAIHIERGAFRHCAEPMPA
jgi:hypothetical protein